MDIHLFKDVKRSDDSHYWFSDKRENGDRYSGATKSFEETLISIGIAIGKYDLKIDKILYEDKQINKDNWSK